ncbi:hypothetical protein [Sphingomonas sp.]|uniref:phage integrase central domain-containing protein n=1 Tax=Sphingomonas sp. TaxID=28214 RepID=UPI0025E96933|nr:hypothetical protein [Sphingomonas sp.]
MIAAGLAPSHEIKLETARDMIAAENSFKAVAEEWIAKNEREDMAEVTLAKIRWLLDKAYPKLGNRPIAKITAQEVLAVLRHHRDLHAARRPAHRRRAAFGHRRHHDLPLRCRAAADGCDLGRSGRRRLAEASRAEDDL